MTLTLFNPDDVYVDRGSKTLLDRIVQLIRKAPTPELQRILTVTAEEVRKFMGTDRVKIYQFHADGSGEVIAESILEKRLPSLLGLHFPAEDIPVRARQLFVTLRMRAIADVAGRRAGKSGSNPQREKKPIFEEIHYQPLDPCHAEYLTAMGVKSSLVVPLLHDDELWGLLVSHHADAYAIEEEKLEDVQRVADLLSVVIAQAQLLEHAREKATREASLNRICAAFPSLQIALEEMVAVFQGSGGRLYIRTDAFDFQQSKPESQAIELYTCGAQPILSELAMFPTIEQYHFWQQHFQSTNHLVWAIADLYRTPELRTLQSSFRCTDIRSLLMIPLYDRTQLVGYLSVFRDQIETEKLWAGRVDADGRQELPRSSFEAWKQTQTGQVRAWTGSELDLAQALSGQFSQAVRQYEMDKQLRSLNSCLEKQVEDRTGQLKKAFARQQALFEGVAKIRESLELNTIFQTTTREARQLLNTDRVAIYRLNSDWSGEFVAESVADRWISLVDGSFDARDLNQSINLCSQKYWKDTYLQDVREGLFPSGSDFLTCNNIYQAGFSKCHLQVLERYQAKAYAIVPIYQRQNLWGLLAAYQNSSFRNWEPQEVKFLEQIAMQISVAIQQAGLLAKTRQQAEQLELTLAHLQATQTQLVQTEKMSSLGQLVAGIAHEINNPVNFIYGNLLHTETYVKEMLDVLGLYQRSLQAPPAELLQRVEEIELEFLVQDLPKMMSSMKLGANRICQIVKSLRNFSRLDEAECKDVDLHEGIESTLSILQHQLKSKVIRVRGQEYDRSEIQVLKNYSLLPLVECYAGQLNQVFMNIFSNAIEAIEQRCLSESSSYTGKITISTEVVEKPKNHPNVVIRIADNGAGIPHGVKERIFDPFFTTKPVGKGTGLGLSISYQIIVEKQGGTFEVESEPGRGTEFKISIPVQ